MSASTILFYLFAGGAVLAAFQVALNPRQRNPLASALWLVLSLLCLAVLFALLQAHLLAVLQVLVYAGAIMVLFIFVIMLLNLGQGSLRLGGMGVYKVLGALGVLALGLVLLLHTLPPAGAAMVPVGAGFGTVAGVGRLLFTRFMFPFELVSLLLLVAIVAAVAVARRRL